MEECVTLYDDFNKAKKWMKKAADKNYPNANGELAAMYFQTKDYDNAIYKLMEIPHVSKKCYETAMDEVANVYKEKPQDYSYLFLRIFIVRSLIVFHLTL